MACVKHLRAALAAVPVAKPCTAAAVAALHVTGHAVAPQLFPWTSPGLRAVARTHAPGELQYACVQQQLPGACMPVLAWLTDGLSSGLPAAASQQALEVACVLLAVVSLVVPADLDQMFWGDAPPLSQNIQRAAVRLLQQLGATGTCLHKGPRGLDSDFGRRLQWWPDQCTTLVGHTLTACLPGACVQRMSADSWQKWERLWWPHWLLQGRPTAQPTTAAAAPAAGAAAAAQQTPLRRSWWPSCRLHGNGCPSSLPMLFV